MPAIPAEMSAKASRLAWLDYAKGLGIILVVVGHANHAIDRTPGLLWSQPLKFLDALIYSFHMPLFFLLAGYAASLGGSRDWRSFARGTIWGVLVPYLVWSVVWISIKATVPDATNQHVDWHRLETIAWNPIEHMWFLYQLLLIRVVWYAAGQLFERTTMLIVVCAAMLAAVSLRSVPGDQHLIAFFLENLALYGLGFVALPAFMGSLTGPHKGFALLAASLGWFACAAQHFSGISAYSVLPAAIFGSLMIVAVAVCLPAPETGVVMRALASIGQASLAIYVMHLIVMAAMRWVLQRTGLLTETALLWACSAAGLVIPLIIYRAVLVAAAATGQPLTNWFGLGPMRSVAYGADASHVAGQSNPGNPSTAARIKS